MNYYRTDHRAPAYIPRGEDPEIPVVFMSIGAVMATAILVPYALVFGSLLLYALAIVALVVLWRWAVDVRRYVVKMPDGSGYRAMYANEELKALQEFHRENPELGEVIEPVLIVSYDLARRLRVDALKERRKAVAELVTDQRRSASGPENNDLTELRAILEIRRQMRQDGLL